MNMSVDGNAWVSETLGHDNIGGFSTYSFQLQKLFDGVWHLPFIKLNNGTRNFLESAGLIAIETDGIYDFFQLRRRYRGYILRALRSLKKTRHGLIRNLVLCPEAQKTRYQHQKRISASRRHPGESRYVFPVVFFQALHYRIEGKISQANPIAP